MEQKRQSVFVAGSNKISGGVYDTVKVMGSGKIEGDIDANSISTAGSCKIDGNVKAGKLKTAGSCKVEGNVEAKEITTTGSCEIEGRVKAGHFKCSGAHSVAKNLIADEITIAGSFKAGGDVEADKILARGSFDIGGLLSADELMIELRGRSEAREIGGERIEVRRRSEFREWRSDRFHRKMERAREKLDRLGIEIDLSDIFEGLEKFAMSFGGAGWGWGHGSLEAETIEGDDIYLEATKAQVVRGKRVIIGEGCEIDTVEYSDSLEVDDSATVKRQLKMGESEKPQGTEEEGTHDL